MSQATGSLLSKVRGWFGRVPETRGATSWHNPDDWLIEGFGGAKTKSGARISPRTALRLSPVWKAVNLVSRDVAKTPLFVQRRVGKGKERDTEHPAYRLLRHKANNFHTAFQLKLILQAQACLHGNGYAWIERDAMQAPRQLVPLDPVETTLHFGGDGTPFYTSRIKREAFTLDLTLPARDVLHIRGLSSDGFVGYAAAQEGKEAIGLGVSAEGYGARFFKNDGRPGLAITHPEHLKPELRKSLQASWNAQHTGEGQHGVAILDEGMKIQPFTVTNQQMQMLETKQFNLIEVANYFMVPPSKLGHPGINTSFSSLQEQNQSYLDEAIDPWMVEWESEVYDKLLSIPQQLRDTHTMEFERKALVRANLEARGEFYNLAINGGWMSRNEVRKQENMNPIPGGEGDEFLVPLNMGKPGEGDPDPEQDPPIPTNQNRLNGARKNGNSRV